MSGMFGIGRLTTKTLLLTWSVPASELQLSEAPEVRTRALSPPQLADRLIGPNLCRLWRRVSQSAGRGDGVVYERTKNLRPWERMKNIPQAFSGPFGAPAGHPKRSSRCQGDGEAREVGGDDRH